MNDERSHTVSIERKEMTVTVVLDDMYVDRATSLAGNNTLDIRNDRVFLGANVDADGKPSDGFSGCITGAKLNHRDLPLSGSTKYYAANPSSGVDTGCTFDPPEAGGAFPTVVTIAAGGVGFLLLFIALPIGIVICVGGRYAYRRRKIYNPRRRHESSRSPTFNWQPVSQRLTNTGDGRHRLMQTSQVSMSDSFALQEMKKQNHSEGGSLFEPSTPAVSEHAFRTPEQTPQQPMRQHHSVDEGLDQDNHHLQGKPMRQHHSVDERLEQENHSPQSKHHVRRLQFHGKQQRDDQQQLRQNKLLPLHTTSESAVVVQPPSVPKVQTQLSNESTTGVLQSGTQVPPVPIQPPSVPQTKLSKASTSARPQVPTVPMHTRSLSGHQSVMTTATEATSVFDDSEVGVYVLKRIEAANEDLKTLQRDEMILFKDEGVFEPLGSIGSLYDIVRDADENYGQSEPVVQPSLKPKLQLSTVTIPAIEPQADTTSKSMKHAKLKPRKTEIYYTNHTDQGIPSEKETRAHSNHVKSNGVLPQPAGNNIIGKPRGRRRDKHVVPALNGGESLMDKFQNITPHSKE